MKLSDIRAALRKVKGNPHVVVELTPGVPLTLMLQKTPLLEELGRAFGNERTAETGLTFDEDTGALCGPLSYDPQADGAPHDEDSGGLLNFDESDTFDDGGSEEDEDDLL